MFRLAAQAPGCSLAGRCMRVSLREVQTEEAKNAATPRGSWEEGGKVFKERAGKNIF